MKDIINIPLSKAIQQEKSVAEITVIQGESQQIGRTMLWLDDGTTHGSLGDGLDEAALKFALKAVELGKSMRQKLTPVQTAKEIEIFIDVNLPSPLLVIVGGVHISIALAELARLMGFRTILVDPRRSFGNRARFPHVDQLLQDWPDQALTNIGLNRSTAVAVVTHDPKLDDPALMVALPSQAFYVGALGSSKTQTARRERLLQAGLSESHLHRLHGPIGLPIRASTTEEIALSIMAEIVAARKAA